MIERIYRYEVPVDDQWHQYPLYGDPLAVGMGQNPAVVEFWARHVDSGAPVVRHFIVVGTGHELPPNAGRHWGNAIWAGTGFGRLVWHLIEEKP